MAAKIWEIQHFFEALHITSLVPTGFKICLWWENDFWEKLPVDEYVVFFFRLCSYPVDRKFRRNRSISHHFRDKFAFAFYAEIQDGYQKWRESDFSEKSPVDYADTLWVKNFVKNTLSYTVSGINALLHQRLLSYKQ